MATRKRTRTPIRSKSPDIETRRKRAVKLRVDGHSYREIADKLRVSVQTAFADVAAVMERTQLAADKLAAEVRAIDLERLDIATKALLPKVKRGDPRAVEKMVAVMARRAKLVGADAPERSELSGPEGAPIEIDARKTLLERLASLADSAAAGGETQEDSGEPQQGGSESSPV